jgi:hypothetical protein
MSDSGFCEVAQLWPIAATQTAKILLILRSIMKKPSSLILALSCIGALSALAAGGRFDAKTWQTVQTYDVRALNKNLRAHVGELVAMKFNFRGKDIHHLKPNWYEGSVWQPDPQGKKGFSDVRVMVSKKDSPAFKSIPTDSTSSAEITIYGRVLWDSESNFAFVQLIGRNAVMDSSGNVNVGW